MTGAHPVTVAPLVLFMIIYTSTNEVPYKDGSEVCVSIWFPVFSLSEWMRNMNLNISLNALTENTKSLLMQQLGIDQSQQAIQCDQSDAVYQPSTAGWNNSMSNFYCSDLWNTEFC